jgi:hypothetical protein
MRPKNARAPASPKPKPDEPQKAEPPRISKKTYKRGQHDHDLIALVARRQRVADAYLRGQSQDRIAQQENVSQAQISRDLATIREDWKQSSIMDFNERKAQELAKIDAVETTAWAAWEKSCKDAEIYHTGVDKGRAGKDGQPLPERQKSWKTVKGQFGDARFLERVAWCINRRCELLGLDAPKKLAPTNPDGTDEYTGGLTSAQRIAGILELVTEFHRETAEGGSTAAAAAASAVEPAAGSAGGGLPSSS